ncbi:MAG TPA: tetratricopeptide repeat protein [Pirellulales bacterium]|nr:tetratricopeptide repeat protein [Pirellulales bacterium]
MSAAREGKPNRCPACRSLLACPPGIVDLPQTAPMDLLSWSDGGFPVSRPAWRHVADDRSGSDSTAAAPSKGTSPATGAKAGGRQRLRIAALVAWPHVLWIVAALAVALGGMMGVVWAPHPPEPVESSVAKQVDVRPPPGAPPADGAEREQELAPIDPPSDETAERVSAEPSAEQAPASAPNPTAEPTRPSLEYDDAHCQVLQARHGVSVPATARTIEIDGRRLPIANPGEMASARSPILFLPRGAHAVRFGPDDALVEVEIADDLANTYGTMRSYFDINGQVAEQELMKRTAQTLDVFGTPFLLNFMGAAYAGRGEWDASERKFRRALRISPAYAPAHLNLAHCLLRRQDREEATREVRLADAFNVGDAFGLNAAIVELKRRLDIPLDDRESPELNIRENAGEIDPTERVLEGFRATLAELMPAAPDRLDDARQVLTQMVVVCREAGYEEADEYQRILELVTP